MSSNTTPNNSELLSAAACEQVVVDVIRSFDIEFARMRDTDKAKRIIQKTMEWYYDTPLYAFFTPQSLDSFANDILTNEALRTFFLNLTERISLNWASSDLSFDEKLLNTYTKGICYNKTSFESNGLSLLNKEVQQSIQTVPETLKSLLKSNIWMFIIYILIVNFDRSAAFSVMSETKK